MTKSVNQIEETQSCSEYSDSEEEYLFGVKTDEQVNTVHQKQPKTTVTINGLLTEMLVDTGSSINVIDEGTFSKLKDKPQLKKSDTKVFTYGSNSHLEMKGHADKYTHRSYHTTCNTATQAHSISCPKTS